MAEWTTEDEKLQGRLRDIEGRLRDEEAFTQELLLTLGRTVNAARTILNVLRSQGTPGTTTDRNLALAARDLDSAFDTLDQYVERQSADGPRAK
jgi:hypothetical protein